jgi:hypothetical protein
MVKGFDDYLFPGLCDACVSRKLGITVTDNEMNLVTIRYNGKIVASSGYHDEQSHSAALLAAHFFAKGARYMHGVEGVR